jgi:hypothetical protein
MTKAQDGVQKLLEEEQQKTDMLTMEVSKVLLLFNYLIIFIHFLQLANTLTVFERASTAAASSSSTDVLDTELTTAKESAIAHLNEVNNCVVYLFDTF